MFISVLDLEREPLEFKETVDNGAIDYGDEVRQVDGLRAQGRAELVLEHRGGRQVVEDIRLRVEFEGSFEVFCARCLDPVRHAIKDQVDLIFRPLGVDAGAPEHSISTSDTEIGYYQDGGLVLEDVLREQVLLSLPARTLCRQDCKGLCARCGRNLNAEACICEGAPSDPRWSALADLRSRMKT
jgi:uncharacterized protein